MLKQKASNDEPTETTDGILLPLVHNNLRLKKKRYLGLSRDSWILFGSAIVVLGLIAAFFAPQINQKLRVTEYSLLVDQMVALQEKISTVEGEIAGLRILAAIREPELARSLSVVTEIGGIAPDTFSSDQLDRLQALRSELQRLQAENLTLKSTEDESIAIPQDSVFGDALRMTTESAIEQLQMTVEPQRVRRTPALEIDSEILGKTRSELESLRQNLRTSEARLRTEKDRAILLDQGLIELARETENLMQEFSHQTAQILDSSRPDDPAVQPLRVVLANAQSAVDGTSPTVLELLTELKKLVSAVIEFTPLLESSTPMPGGNSAGFPGNVQPPGNDLSDSPSDNSSGLEEDVTPGIDPQPNPDPGPEPEPEPEPAPSEEASESGPASLPESFSGE